MSLEHLFKPLFVTGQTIKIVTPKGAMLDSCEVNIGTLAGKARSVSAILCDGVDESDPWHIVNIVDKNKMLLDHVAVKGAVSLGQAERLCQKYIPLMSQGEVRNITAMTDNAVKTFLDSLNLPTGTPFVLENDAVLLDAMGTVSPVVWSDDNKLLSHGGHVSGVMYDMACCDSLGELTEQVSPRDIASLLIDEQCQFGGMLDAMIIKNRQFDMVIQKIAEALKSYDNDEFFVRTVTPLEPFKRNGVVNVGAIFEMSDTQLITVLFNNPDTTPSKLMPDDVLTSWKWMLNKRDVTAILQPRAVESKKYPLIASRMIKLLAKNHARFKRTQALRVAEEKILNSLIDQVESAQSQLRSMDAEINAVQQSIDAETIRKQNLTEIGKADLTAEGAEAFHEGLKEQLSKNQENSEDLIKQKATDLKELLISSYDFTTDTLAHQGEHTHNLLTKNGAHLAIFTFIDETANDIWTLGLSSGGEINRLAEIDTRADINEIAQKIAEFDDKVTVLTGDELGDFDLPEEIEKLRAIVGELLAEMKKTPIFCPALNTSVNIGSNVIKKTLGFSADTRKLKALAHLKELLQNADKIQELPNRKQGKSENVKAFHILSSSLNLDGEPLEVRYVIREDNNGHYHYDNSVKKTVFKNAESPLLDGLIATVFPTPCATHEDHALQIQIANCQREDSIENNQNTVNMMLDDASDSGEVLNMFIVSVADKQDDQTNTIENTSHYSFDGGTVKITKNGDVYSAFLAHGSVGGEFEGEIKAIQAWLSVRLQKLGEALEGSELSWERTSKQLTLQSGDDYLGVHLDFVEADEILAIETKFDLAKLIVSKLSTLTNWSKKGSTAVREVKINDEDYRFKFDYAPLSKGYEFRIVQNNEVVTSCADFEPSRESVEDAVKSLERGVINYIENKLQHTVKQSNEQNIQPEDKPKTGAVFKKEAESVYRSIDYSVLDYHGHTEDEFKRANVKGNLEPKIAEAEALLTRRFRDQYQREQVEKSIENARKMIARWESKQVESVASEPSNEYRYALLRRSAGGGSTPSEGFIRSEDAPSDLATFARFGIAFYDRKLTDDEMQQAEIKYIPTAEELQDAIVGVATELSKHKNASKYLAKIRLGDGGALELMIAKAQKDLYSNWLFTRPQQFLFDVANAFVTVMTPEAVEPEVVENTMSETEQFLNDVIGGTVDMSDPSFSDKLLTIAEDLDPSLEALFEQASDAYADYAISLAI